MENSGMYNPGHTILELYSVIFQVLLATSKTKLDIFYNKLGARVPSRVSERHKTQNSKISNLGGDLVPSPPFQKLNFGRSTQKKDIKVFQPHLI